MTKYNALPGGVDPASEKVAVGPASLHVTQLIAMVAIGAVVVLGLRVLDWCTPQEAVDILQVLTR